MKKEEFHVQVEAHKRQNLVSLNEPRQIGRKRILSILLEMKSIYLVILVQLREYICPKYFAKRTNEKYCPPKHTKCL
jgi:hypothetical protein